MGESGLLVSIALQATMAETVARVTGVSYRVALDYVGAVWDGHQGSAGMVFPTAAVVPDWIDEAVALARRTAT